MHQPNNRTYMADKITVTWKEGIEHIEKSREFSVADHGENFLDVAKQFAATNQGQFIEEEVK